MQARVQVFARAAVSGEVKTRLIPRLGADGAARLQQILATRSVETALAANIGQVELWCTPDTSHPGLAAFERRGVVLHDQGPGDLGTRMQRAIEHALANGDVAVLIGSDCPTLTDSDLRSAVQALQLGSDVAVAPAEDGGYVLIAARQCSPRLFDGITWGSDTVMEETRQRLRELRWSWKELPQRWDVDRPQDYDRLLREQPAILRNFT
jgi:rSAM/selenodomain-associated transferase 1